MDAMVLQEPLDIREAPGRAMGKVAELWRPTESGRVVCTACARYCKIGEGQVGLCGIRGVHQGKLWLYTYGKVITGHVDPIEKKPVTHYRPGSKIFSIATTGCNWLCRYCLLPGTLVLTKDGALPIEQLFRDSDATDHSEVRTVEHRAALTHRNRWRRIVKAFQHFYVGVVLRLETTSNLSVTCTPNHGVFALRPNGYVRKVRADSLRVGTQVAVPLAAINSGLHDIGFGNQVMLSAFNPEGIRLGDYCLETVRETTALEYAGPVYNIEVDEDHSYTANSFAVANCQNYDISQRRKIEGIDAQPEDIVRMTLEQGCQGLAYTYNQPTIFIEFARDIGILARKAGLINIFVSNGYDTPEVVEQMKPFLDCITVDFKGSGETQFVRKFISIPNADPIFSTLKEIRDKTKIHTEITDLIVPQVGDDLDAAKVLSKFVYDELGPDTPIHFLRFHPDYKMMDLPWTPVETLEKHCEVAKAAGLRYVYIGNVPGHPLEHTYCPSCGAIAVRRYGFDITGWELTKDNRCKKCDYKLPIYGSLEKTVKDERYYSVLSHR